MSYNPRIPYRMPGPHRPNLRECIRHFSPAWFTLNMGTGVVSSLASRFHFGLGSLAVEVISLAFFFLNLALFVLFCGLTVARYWMYPESWRHMISHPNHSLFVGAFAMGAATLINSALTANQDWSFAGTGFLYTLWAFWWVDLFVSYLTAFGVMHAMMTTQSHSVATMASGWIIPIVTLIVASSTGGLLTTAIHPHSLHIATLTTAVSLTSVVMGLSLALMVVTVYLTRLLVHGLPPTPAILSVFMTLGPVGQGGFSLLVNGQNLETLLPLHPGRGSGAFPDAALTGQMLHAACFCGAWVMWAMGVAWLTIATIALYTVVVHRRERIPFSFGYWGVIFPTGVYVLLTVQLGETLDSPFFQYLGAIWSVAILLLWTFVTIKTIPVVWNRSIFVDPTPTSVVEKPATSERTSSVTLDSSRPAYSSEA